MSDLFEGLIGLAVTLYAAYALYRLTVWLLRRAGGGDGAGRFVGAESGRGGDKLRLAIGKLFSWNVAVNEEKGTLGGSIHIGAPKGRLVVGALVAVLAAFAVPAISALLLPAALVVVAIRFLRRVV